ncbi:hypothetical protein FQR65_LT19943 [Abscondita terminalis]|nr:hypothetical protein FQR65_LT19943 [Abscondita terminalis]
MNELKNCATPRQTKPPKKVKRDLFADEVLTKSKTYKQNRNESSRSVKKKTSVSSSSSESYDSDDICQESDDSNFVGESNESFESFETKFTVTQKEICLNDFVSVQLKEVKKQVVKEFVGQIIRVVGKETHDLEVAYEHDGVEENFATAEGVEDNNGEQGQNNIKKWKKKRKVQEDLEVEVEAKVEGVVVDAAEEEALAVDVVEEEVVVVDVVEEEDVAAEGATRGKRGKDML